MTRFLRFSEGKVSAEDDPRNKSSVTMINIRMVIDAESLAMKDRRKYCLWHSETFQYWFLTGSENVGTRHGNAPGLR